MKKITMPTVLLAAALCACGQAPAADPTDGKRETRKPPTTGFQRMIYDEQGFAVVRDRETGCQWIAVLVGGRSAEAIVPRNGVSSNGRIEQLCTATGDPLSRPMKVDGERSMFQRVSYDDIGRDISMSIFRDMETGCEWIVTDSGVNEYRRIVQPRTVKNKDGVQQVCSPLDREPRA